MMLSTKPSRFDDLPARPPTPPREISKAIDAAISFLEDSNEVENALISKPIAPGPKIEVESPSSSRGIQTICNPAKRVDFSPNPTFHPIARVGPTSSPSHKLSKHTRPARDLRPGRSILKQAHVASPLTPDDLESRLSYFSPQIPGSFAKMLQSVLRQLASPTISDRLDAYLVLNGTLKTHEGVPDPQSMAAKMGLLMQFVSRDMAWKDASGGLDVNIVTQALKLVIALLFDPKLSVALDDDFRTFLVDRSIAMLEQSETQKAIVKTHLFLLAQQRFNASIMTPGRADRIITALGSIEDHHSGNSVVASRLVIYQRLLERVPAVMAGRSKDWLPNTFHGMLSSVQDVRMRAIELCTVAGLALGTQPSATKALNEMFQNEDEEGRTYCDYLNIRLLKMTGDKDAAAYVPQICAAVILFFRNKRAPLENWNKFKAWLLVLQRCMNASDSIVKYQASLAWNKLVFTVMPNASTSPTMYNMLSLPIISNMEKSGKDKFSRQCRQFGIDSYYNLLHYSLRPGLTHEELDRAWNTYVGPWLSKHVRTSELGRRTACEILQGLCKPSAGAWNANAANEPTAIRVDELPRLDPRWVRSRLSKILVVLEPVIQSSMLSTSGNESNIDSALRAVLSSVVDAGAQEVKTSNDTKEGVAHLVNMLSSLWRNCAATALAGSPEVFAARYTASLSMVIEKLGAPLLTEPILIKEKEGVSLEAAITPAHRTSKHPIAPRSAAIVLFGLLYQPPRAIGGDTDLSVLSSSILGALTSVKATQPAKLEVLKQALHIWTTTYASTAEPAQAARLWIVVVDYANSILEHAPAVGDSHDSQTLGHELRYTLDILAQGFRYLSQHEPCLRAASQLYIKICKVARARAGPGGIALEVLEPFAKTLVETDTDVNLRARTHLATTALTSIIWPRSRLELDQARKALWGVSLAPHKPAVFDPFEHAYRLIDDTLTRAYRDPVILESTARNSTVDLFGTCLSFLEACPLSLLAVALRKMQNGFSIWILDKEAVMNGKSVLAVKVSDLWDRILGILDTLPNKDSTVLQALEPLLIAGLSSPQKRVVNQTIAFWNATFGMQVVLEYPSGLAAVLRVRSTQTEVNLPTFGENVLELESPELPDFLESQVELPSLPAHMSQALRKRSPSASRVQATESGSRDTESVEAKSLAGSRVLATEVPRTRTQDSRSSTPKRAKLRHDDSQIQFAPIDSSPLLFAAESQALTDHQREIRMRQQANAQMFPDLSSSPAKSTTLHHYAQKKLDFTSDAKLTRDEGDSGTPSDTPGVVDDLNEDVRSSPTPSSARGTSTPRPIEADEQDLEDQEIASSPPRAHDEDILDHRTGRKSSLAVQPDNNAMDATTDLPDASHLQLLNPEDSADVVPGDNEFEQEHPSDLPSDTILPELQLQQEEAEAALFKGVPNAPSPLETKNVVVEDNSTTARLTRSQSASQLSVEAAEPDEVSRVENSFLGQMPELMAPVNDESGHSQQSQSSTRKRKRQRSTLAPKKKRSQKSPLQRFGGLMASFIGRTQTEDDDMEEEIIVASSQVASSPVMNTIIDVPQPARTGPHSASGNVSALHVEQPQKLHSGRSRRLAASTAGESESAVVTPPTLKRKSSALSEAHDALPGSTTSFVENTPAPVKQRKQRQGRDLQLADDARLSQDVAYAPRITRRSMGAVVIPFTGHPGDLPAFIDSSDDDSRADMAAIQHPYLPGQLAPTTNATVDLQVSPRSILGRLRDVLADLPKMFLGSQEERQMDNVLFDIRREVHEASRRFRDQT